MNSLRHLTFIGIFVLVLVCMATPTQTTATILWGHPYAVQINDSDNGWVHMWNANNVPPYAGTGMIHPVGTSTAHQNMWDLLIQGMVDKKLTVVWTDHGPDSNINDGSTGNIEAAVVTIFGD